MLNSLRSLPAEWAKISGGRGDGDLELAPLEQRHLAHWTSISARITAPTCSVPMVSTSSGGRLPHRRMVVPSSMPTPQHVVVIVFENRSFDHMLGFTPPGGALTGQAYNPG